jgi:hypothetical protein
MHIRREVIFHRLHDIGVDIHEADEIAQYIQHWEVKHVEIIINAFIGYKQGTIALIVGCTQQNVSKVIKRFKAVVK